MPVTADTVEVRLKADTAKYVKDLNAADAAFGKVASGIERDVARVNTATGAMSLNTANIAAQFQDIGVTSAMGMNPLLIALQQGTQLSAVLNQSVGQGISPVKALGAAFAQIVNPISLATIAIVAMGAAALQGLGSILPASESATEAIKKHREALEGIVRGYERAEDAVDAYFDAARRLPQSIAAARTEEEFRKLSEGVAEFRSQMERFSQDDMFSKYGSDTNRTMQQLAGEFARGELSAEQFYLELETLKDGLNLLERAGSAIPGSTSSMIASWQEGALKAEAFGNAINNLVTASAALAGLAVDSGLQNALDLRTYIAEQDRINSLTTEQLQLEKEIARIKGDAGEFGITDAKAAELAERALAAEKRRAEIAKQLRDRERAGESAARKYEQERKAIEDLLAEMGLQVEMLGQSNREKAVSIALSKANATATEEERVQIAQMAGYIYDTEKAIDHLNSTSQEWANTLQSATRGFIDDLIAGKSAAEAFSNVLSNIANQLINAGLSNLFGSNGLNVAGLFGGTATRAMGGSVYAGKPTLVGERGPELFIPSTPGKIIPNSQVSGGGSVVFAPNIDARGADVAAVARIEQTLQRMASEIVPTIRKEIANGPKKGRA